MDQPIGLAGKVAHGKGYTKHDGEETVGDGEDSKAAEFAVTEDECMADISFTLGNGKVIAAPRMDLCNLDGIIVEDVPAQDPGTAVPAH
jgi:hypothetical protein